LRPVTVEVFKARPIRPDSQPAVSVAAGIAGADLADGCPILLDDSALLLFMLLGAAHPCYRIVKNSGRVRAPLVSWAAAPRGVARFWAGPDEATIMARNLGMMPRSNAMAASALLPRRAGQTINPEPPALRTSVAAQ